MAHGRGYREKNLRNSEVGMLKSDFGMLVEPGTKKPDRPTRLFEQDTVVSVYPGSGS